MIKYLFNKKTYEIEVSGHANFDEHGKDIVCASVSTAVILSANLIERLNEQQHISVKVEDGYFHITVKTLTDHIKAILDNLIWTLQELEKQYPKYIKYQKER